MSSLVLMYHGVGDETAPHAELRYTVSVLSFRQQMQALSGHPVVTLSELLARRAPAGAVVLTFDDGEQSVATRALPLLASHGFKGVLFVTTGWIGTPGYCSEEELRRLARAGWEIGAHGVSHRFLTELDDRELRSELGESRGRLADILGEPPQHLALPGGRGDRRVVEAARAAGYLSVSTSRAGRNSDPPDPWAVRRVMVQRGHRAAWLARLAAGDRRLLVEIRVRQELLDHAKRLLGERRYQALRAAASRLLPR